MQIQSIQGNPNQPDVSFRGFTASPVLGTPQGLSVYMDGVRMNQPFGDVVSWDLIPKVAIDSMTLMPGSNPFFGLNTLGGSLSLRTKDGINWPGSAVQLSAGLYGRRALELEHGFAHPQGLDGYFAANLAHAQGRFVAGFLCCRRRIPPAQQHLLCPGAPRTFLVGLRYTIE